MKDKILIYFWWLMTMVCYRLTKNKKLFKLVFDRIILKGE